MRQTQSLAHLHGKTSECSTAWPPEHEPELLLCQSDGILLEVFFSFLVAPLLGERESLAARYQTMYDLTEQSMKKTYFPFYTWQ